MEKPRYKDIIINPAEKSIKLYQQMEKVYTKRMEIASK